MDTTAKPRAHTHASPATLALLSAGCTVTELADAVRRPRATVSNHLIGRHPVPSDVAAAMADLIGPDAARRVLSLIPDHPAGLAA